MRTFFYRCFLAVILIATSVVYGQNKLDFWLKDAIRTYNEEPAKLLQKTQRGLRIETATGRPMVNVILQTQNGEFSFVHRYGGTLRTIAGPYATAILPLAALEEISLLAEVAYVSGTVELQKLNDLATKAIGSSAAIAAGYTGDGAIIGVIDSGIDIKHPGFENASGTRILYVWDQSEAMPGKSPTYPAYDYGVEWTKEQIDQGLCTSKDTDGHGTHVAGSIAQYIPTGPDSAYHGSAIAANLIIVKSNYRSNEILDGINYIFEKARQLGKPAIVNISLGSQQGPHDGLDPYTAAQDYLTGPGRLIVQSAGNDGDNPIHHMVTADSNGEDMAFTIDGTAKVLNFELWYDGIQNTSIQIFAPGNVVFPSIPAGSSATINSSSGKAIVDNASGGPEYYNGDKRISLTLENAVAGNWRLRLSSSSPTVVQAWMWNADTTAHFKFATNNNHYTLVNEACARTNIVVGATVTRNQFRVRDVPGIPDGTELMTNEVLGQLASFSSGGPTRDGREKPDIVAPGTMIASALSSDVSATGASSSTDFRSIGPRYPVFESEDQQYMQGTSMSGPVAGGGFAQMFPKPPAIAHKLIAAGTATWSVEQRSMIDHTIIKSYLKRFSQDIGSIPAGIWHYRAGYGMINMQALIDNKIQVTSLAQTADDQIVVTFNKAVTGADNPANYSIIGPSSARRVINAQTADSIVTLTLDGKLIEGERDSLRIQNVSAIAGLEVFADLIEVEIDKFGTIVAPHHVLTNEIWHREKSPYYIHGRVEIPSFVKLTIEAGTMVKFMPKTSDSSQLLVFGQLIAEGSEKRPIVFTSLTETKNGEWEGLYFDSDIPPTTLKFCEIRYADDSIVCLSSNLTLEDCKISHSLNTGFFAQNCSPTLKRTIIWDSNGGEFDDGIQLINASSTTLIENVTIHGNGRIGIACFSSNPRIINSIVSNNAGPGIHSQQGAPPMVTYSNVFGNSPNYSGVTPGIGCISADPRFVNSTVGNFHLQQNSPCIDAGEPSPQFNDPDGTRNDMGALPRIASLLAFGARSFSGGVELTWTTVQTDKVEGALILRSRNEPVTGKPENGMQYETGAEIGNALVVYSMVGGNDPGRHIDSAVEASTTYHYSAWTIYKGYLYSDSPLTASTTTTAVDERVSEADLPTIYDLQQNYPNPFNPSTIIAFDLPKASEVKLNIYDLQGQLIRMLLQAWRPAGRYKSEWDGKGDSNQSVSSGIYIIHLRAGTFEKTQKAILVK